MDKLDFGVINNGSCNTVTSTTRTNSTIHDEEEDGQEGNMYVTKQNNGGWFCSACNCQIFQEQLNQHFLYHTIFISPVTDENENDDDDSTNQMFDEFSKQLGEVLATFSEKRKKSSKNDNTEAKQRNDKYINTMMDLYLSDEENSETQNNLKNNNVNEEPSNNMEMILYDDDNNNTSRPITPNIRSEYKTKVNNNNNNNEKNGRHITSSKGNKTDIELEERKKLKKKNKKEKKESSDEGDDNNNNIKKEKSDSNHTKTVNTSSNPQKNHHHEKHHKSHKHHSSDKEKEKKKERKKSGDSTSEECSTKNLALKNVFNQKKHNKIKRDEDRKFINDSEPDYEKKKKKSSLSSSSSDPTKHNKVKSSSNPTSTITTPKTTEKRKLKINHDTDEEIIKPKKSKESKHHSKGDSSENSKEQQHHHSKSSKETNDSSKQQVLKKSYQYLINSKNKYKSPMIQTSIESMMAEMDKENPSVPKLHELMNATFKYRECEFEQYEDPIPNSLRDFPAFKQWSIVKAEFDKIKKDKNVTFSKLESKLSDKLFKYQASFELHNYLIHDKLLQKAKDDFKHDENNKVLLRDIQILCLAFKKTNNNWNLNGSLYKQRVKGERPFSEVTPCIDIRGDLSSSSKRITVFCERKEICRAPNMFEAIMCCYALYWIYNLCYETNAEPIYDYFDQLLKRKE